MTFTLQQLQSDFALVDSTRAAIELEHKYGFTKDGVPQTERDNLGTTGAVIEGATVRLASRWYDPSGPFQNEPDIHKLRMEINGYLWGERSFEG